MFPAHPTRCDQLQEAGRDISHAHTSPAGVTHDATIGHDLDVQAAVLRRLPLYDEVIWKPHITLPEPFEKPDVLLRSPQGAWVALDYERQRKDDSRIYIAFRNHAEAIMNQHYRGVHLLFDRSADLERYRTLFDADAWPEYDFNRKKGKITALTTTFNPDTVPNLRQCFVFILEDKVTPAPSGARDPEAADPPSDERQSAEATRTRTPRRNPKTVRLASVPRGEQARRMASQVQRPVGVWACPGPLGTATGARARREGSEYSDAHDAPHHADHEAADHPCDPIARPADTGRFRVGHALREDRPDRRTKPRSPGAWHGGGRVLARLRRRRPRPRGAGGRGPSRPWLSRTSPCRWSHGDGCAPRATHSQARASCDAFLTIWCRRGLGASRMSRRGCALNETRTLHEPARSHDGRCRVPTFGPMCRVVPRKYWLPSWTPGSRPQASQTLEKEVVSCALSTVIPHSNIPEPSAEKSSSSSWTGSGNFGFPPLLSWPNASA